MVETVSTEEFTTGAVRRKPESFEFVRFRIDSGVARLTLNRPDHNLLNEAMLREIADGIVFAGEHDDVKLIAIDSACKVFSGGVDIGEYTTQRVYQMLEAFHAAFAAMLEASKPVLCVINGPAIGGGAELAAFGDLVIATPKARFAQPEITIGVFPPLASTILPFLVGPKRALEIILTANRLPPSARLNSAWSLVSFPKPSSTPPSRNSSSVSPRTPARFSPWPRKPSSEVTDSPSVKA